jgi:hypothetical protein
MNAHLTQEKPMSEDSRIVKLETQVAHIQSDMTELKGEVRALAKEFSSFRAEVAARFGEVAARFGAVDASIERAIRWLMGVGVTALVTMLGMVGHALKWL